MAGLSRKGRPTRCCATRFRPAPAPFFSRILLADTPSFTGDQDMSTPHESHLFYLSSTQRPHLAEARGVYMWDVDGKRYLDGSSGAMVSNIGHSHPHVQEALKRQIDKYTFGYRLHFQTEASEALAAKTAALAPEGMEKVFFVS